MRCSRPKKKLHPTVPDSNAAVVRLMPLAQQRFEEGRATNLHCYFVMFSQSLARRGKHWCCPRAPAHAAVSYFPVPPTGGEEPRWRPGRSLDPSAPSPATPRYPSRRPPSGLAVTAGTVAWLGETGAFNSRCERSPDLVRGESGTRRSASGASRSGGSCGCSPGRALTGRSRFLPPRLPATGRAGEARPEEDCAVCPAGRPGTPTRRAGAPF
ncbi:hypothetical protein NDU88_001021 [Pleurodeles waltl]|uniref:Uncharacterized protein n=1 Tax=Pleurodeles waltl TaxID=8319 RepID=A0AAV7P2L9_PLEWA|nr:hypothetical protein NDU88_001021 [Pleurodeles waltl]